MPKQSQRWKQLERSAAESLGGKRVVRGADFSVSEVDVRIEDFPHLKVDCKAYNAFSHHSLMAEIQNKYCKDEDDVPVLVTKASRQIGEYVTIPLEHYARMLERVRHYRKCLCFNCSAPLAVSSQSPSR
jgi:hypothetical protein